MLSKAISLRQFSTKAATCSVHGGHSCQARLVQGLGDRHCGGLGELGAVTVTALVLSEAGTIPTVNPRPVGSDPLPMTRDTLSACSVRRMNARLSTPTQPQWSLAGSTHPSHACSTCHLTPSLWARACKYLHRHRCGPLRYSVSLRSSPSRTAAPTTSDDESNAGVPVRCVCAGACTTLTSSTSRAVWHRYLAVWHRYLNRTKCKASPCTFEKPNMSHVTNLFCVIGDKLNSQCHTSHSIVQGLKRCKTPQNSLLTALVPTAKIACWLVTHHFALFAVAQRNFSTVTLSIVWKLCL